MALDIPVPSASPYDDPDQYLPLILSAIEGFLLAQDVWTPETYSDARGYIEQLKRYVVDCWGKCGDGAMIGEIKIWSKSNVPAGYLSCNGQAVSRTDYQALFDVISTAYGSGNGTTTFNVPNLSDRSPMGLGATSGAVGSQSGAFTHQLITNELPAHNHRLRVGNGASAFQLIGGGGSNPTVANGVTTSTTPINSGDTGGGASHNNLHPVLAVHFIIFAGV